MTTEPICRDGVLTVKEAAAFLRLGETKFFALMRDGEVRFVKLGRRTLIPKVALVELLERGLSGGTRP